MIKNIPLISVGFALFMWGASNATNAATIPGLYNTGAGITTDKTQDTHYQLTKTAGDGAPSAASYGYAAVGSGWPIDPWLADNSTSHWLTPSSSRGESYDPSVNGQYTWTLTFDLTGFDFASAMFSGRFAADNEAVAYLNNVQIGAASGFTDWYLFSATSSLFKAGTNILKFVVTNYNQNDGNPTGIRVEFTSSNVNPVPVPAAIWLFGSSLLALGVLKRRVI